MESKKALQKITIRFTLKKGKEDSGQERVGKKRKK